MVAPRTAIFLAMGPSGAGKDTLLLGARQALMRNLSGTSAIEEGVSPLSGDGSIGSGTVVFVKRHITRDPARTTDLEIPCSENEFTRLSDAGAFALSWAAHGTRYGILRTSLVAAMKGATAMGRDAGGVAAVVLNVSRSIGDEVRARYGDADGGVDVYQLNITAPAAVLRTRLQGRGRETPAEIDSRIARGAAMRPAGDTVVTVVNTGSVSAGIAAVVQALMGRRKYSLWLVPPAASAFLAAATEVIADLATLNGTAPFSPHVTLGCTSAVAHQEAVLQAGRAVARGLPNTMRIRPAGAGGAGGEPQVLAGTSQPWQVVTLPVRRTDELVAACVLADRCISTACGDNNRGPRAVNKTTTIAPAPARTLALTPEHAQATTAAAAATSAYHPHVSLAYGHLTPGQLEGAAMLAAGVLAGSTALRGGFTASELAVVMTSGDAWECWVEVARFPLGVQTAASPY